MGLELIVSTKKDNTHLCYWCRDNVITRAFDDNGYLICDDESHELTDRMLEDIINSLKEEHGCCKDRLNSLKKILETPMSLQDKLECQETIDDVENDLDYLLYAIYSIEFLKNQVLCNLTYNEDGLQYYVSY